MEQKLKATLEKAMKQHGLRSVLLTLALIAAENSDAQPRRASIWIKIYIRLTQLARLP